MDPLLYNAHDQIKILLGKAYICYEQVFRIDLRNGRKCRVDIFRPRAQARTEEEPAQGDLTVLHVNDRMEHHRISYRRSLCSDLAALCKVVKVIDDKARAHVFTHLLKPARDIGDRKAVSGHNTRFKRKYALSA